MAKKRPTKRSSTARTTSAKSAKKKAPVKAKKVPVKAKKAPVKAKANAKPLRAKKAAPSKGDARPSGLKSGDKAPAFELMDQSGNKVSSRSLAGKPYVLYFYPRDNTPGCTTEACAFRDAHPNFDKLGIRVLGVSADSVKSHAGFAEKYELPFTLLADPEKQLISAYGCWVRKQNYGREYMGIERSTFLIDKRGRIVESWRGVRVNGHADAVLEAARKLG